MFYLVGGMKRILDRWFKVCVRMVCVCVCVCGGGVGVRACLCMCVCVV